MHIVIQVFRFDWIGDIFVLDWRGAAGYERLCLAYIIPSTAYYHADGIAACLPACSACSGMPLYAQEEHPGFRAELRPLRNSDVFHNSSSTLLLCSITYTR